MNNFKTLMNQLNMNKSQIQLIQLFQIIIKIIIRITRNPFNRINSYNNYMTKFLQTKIIKKMIPLNYLAKYNKTEDAEEDIDYEQFIII